MQWVYFTIVLCSKRAPFISLIIATLRKSKGCPEAVAFLQQALLANATSQFSSYINRSPRRQRWNFSHERLHVLNVSLSKYSRPFLRIVNANRLKWASNYISKHFFLSSRQTGWQIHAQGTKPNNSVSNYRAIGEQKQKKTPSSLKRLAGYRLQLRSP